MLLVSKHVITVLEALSCEQNCGNSRCAFKPTEGLVDAQVQQRTATEARRVLRSCRGIVW